LRSLDADDDQTSARRRAAGRGALRGLVLPRLLRRPARALERLLQRRIAARFGTIGLAALFVATAVGGTLIGGHGMAMVSAVTAWSGLGIDRVVITGQSETSEIDILDRLAIADAPSLLTFDVDAARARVQTLPWIDDITLTKLYPDELAVAVSERVPFAIWQHGEQMSLVDRSGKVIVDAVGERYASLPHVVGPGAAERAGEFTNLIGAFPDIAWRVRAGALVSERRWTIVLNNDMALMLPEDDPAGALLRISQLDAEHALLSREIAAVDLRAGDRMVLRLSDAGIAARTALLKERAAAVNRTGT
jgi:cell division protein FtsQ